MTIPELKKKYEEGTLTPRECVDQILDKIKAYDDHNVWIYTLTKTELEPYFNFLETQSPADLPLYGIPFAIKDNIDLADIPTTAGCEAYTYIPKESATVVDLLLKAGAIPVGKTNMDQFATGLVGTRSPEKWGPCKNAFNREYISGGSSAGSAVAVALDLACFSLGTDTAGSGRVPAAFNDLVGLKPSRGLLSTKGVVPACRSLDCVSIFANSSLDANCVFDVVCQLDPEDDYSSAFEFKNELQSFGHLNRLPKIGILAEEQVESFGDKETPRLYREFCNRLVDLGFETKVIDYQPFNEAANLLYSGPWLAERHIATSDFLDDMLEITKSIISNGTKYSALDTFRAQYRLQGLKKVCDRVWGDVDVVLTPTTPSHYTIAEVEAEPAVRNTELGYYTNFMNLLDYSAVAIPAGKRSKGLPSGVTLFAPKFEDKNLLSLTHYLQINGGDRNIPAAQSGEVDFVVCGAHMRGLPLNWQLTTRHATFIEQTHTGKSYKFYALAGGPPFRPGLIRDPDGTAIEVEVWSMPVRYFGSFVAGIPKPLGIGQVELADGRWVSSFICEGYAVEDATDITDQGSWRKYIEQKEIENKK